MRTILIRRVPDLAWRKVGGETIIIHLARKTMYGLDPAGGRIWEALEEPASLEDLRRRVPAEAGREAATDAALLAFLAELEAEGLISVDGMPERRQEDPGQAASSPSIAWREEIRRFAGACAFYPGVSVVCDQQPFNS